MIIKIDHIALSSIDFPRATQDLLRLGYKKQFENDNIKNLQIKKPLLDTWSEDHDLALFSCGSNIPIELLNHRSVRDVEPSFLMPIIRGATEEMTKSKNIVSIAKQRGVLTTIGSFDCIVIRDEEQTFILKELTIYTNDLDESEFFWSYFGFRCVLTDSDYRILKFVSPLQVNPCTLYLLQSTIPIRETNLDDAGFASLAFLSNDVEKEREELLKKNVQISKVEELTVNGKAFNICFARGNQGEIVELLSLKTI